MKRTETISTQHLKTLKIILWTFNLGIVGAAGLSLLFVSLTNVLTFGLWMFLPVLFLTRVMGRLRDISFDDQFIYYTHNGYEVQIPMYDIASVEIISLSGLFKINLIVPTQIGTTIYFKPSIWYPINHNKHDEKVNILRSKILNAKRNRQPEQGNALAGYTI